MSIQKLFASAVDNSGGVLKWQSQPDVSQPFRPLIYMENDGRSFDDVAVVDIPRPEDPALGIGDDTCSWHLGAALNVPGLKHVFSNISSDVLDRWQEYSNFQEALSAVNQLHFQTFYRDRLQRIISSPMDKLYTYYEGGNLISWRWSSLIDVAEAIHRRQGALKACWSLQRFLAVGQRSDDDSTSNTKLFATADLAIRSPFFWAYLRMVILLHGLVNDLGSWAEGSMM